MPRVRVILLSLRSTMVLGCGAPEPVALDGDRVGPEHLDPSVADPPSGEVAADQGVHVQSDVSLLQPADDPPEGEVVDVVEGPRRDAVTEVVAPSPQRRVQPAEQVGERSMFRSASERSDLGRHREQALLGRVGVDGSLAGPALPGPALDARPQEVEPLVEVADPRLLFRQAQAHRSEHRGHFAPERFGVVAGAVDHDHEVEPFDVVGAQLCPCSIATATPQAFTVAFRPATSPSQGVPSTEAEVRAAAQPGSARFELVVSS